MSIELGVAPQSATRVEPWLWRRARRAPVEDINGIPRLLTLFFVNELLFNLLLFISSFQVFVNTRNGK